MGKLVLSSENKDVYSVSQNKGSPKKENIKNIFLLFTDEIVIGH